MYEMSLEFDKSFYLCALLFSLPAKRFLNALFKKLTNRYYNPLRVEIFIDIAIFACILIWVGELWADKKSVPEVFSEYGYNVADDII